MNEVYDFGAVMVAEALTAIVLAAFDMPWGSGIGLIVMVVVGSIGIYWGEQRRVARRIP